MSLPVRRIKQLLAGSFSCLLILFSGLQVHFSWPGGAKWGKAPLCTQHTVTLWGLLSPWTVALPDGDSVWAPHAMVLRYRALCWLLTWGICNCPKAGRWCWMQSWDPPVPWGQVQDPGLCWWHFHPLLCSFSPDLPLEHLCCCPHRATAAAAHPAPLPRVQERGSACPPRSSASRGCRSPVSPVGPAAGGARGQPLPAPLPGGAPGWAPAAERRRGGAFKRERRGGAVSPHINLS